MNVFEHVEGLIASALKDLQGDGVLPSELALPHPEAEATHGSAVPTG